jgi:hypothetical protein
MPIVGGLDIHRKQLTFDYLDTVTGARSPRPTGRTHGPGWRGSPAAATSRSRWRGAPGGGMWPRSWPRPGSPRMWASRPTPPPPAVASGMPNRQDRFAAPQGAAGRGPAARVLDSAGADLGVPGAAGDLSRPAPRAHRLGAAARCSSTRAPRRWVRARCAPSRAWPRRPAPDGRESAGRPAVWRRPGHRAGADLLAGRGGPVLLLPQGGPVHRAGHHRLVLGPQRPARAAVPAGTTGAALGCL